ncbi:helix-turn-helix domain-containing protein [Actinocorallia populi]|uniref:helix-turn-helix domain-containing protein n=1 Tax=Actinocorallia populi TaxID=2079200 RepID=UPI000D095EA1|nr:helix-turn-helix domain-containing protein [Actinocorallia populi]
MPSRESLRRRRTELQAVWTRYVQGGAVRAGGGAAELRDDVAESWRRSLATVDPGQVSAPSVDGDAERRWRESPLREPVLAVADELRTITDDAGFVAAVTDESGTILWTCGEREMRRRAGAVNFAPGGRWGEEAMGTNALSLALRNDTASTVFSAEHLVHALHGWVCYCTPLHGPDGSVLGVLDLSSTWDRSHPLAMPALRTLAGAVETRLAERYRGGPDGSGLVEGHGGWHLSCLGGTGLARGGAPVRLRPRQIEILTLLALEGRALTPEFLRTALYGDRRVTSATLKAEVSHLRRALRGALSVRRYELTEPVGCDASDVLAALRAGRTGEALRSYGGPLLPDSEAPGIVVWRDHIEVALREAVLSSADPQHALHYGELHPEDLEVHEHALVLLGGDPRRGLVLARINQAALEG